MAVLTSSRNSATYAPSVSTPTPSRSHPSWPMSPPSTHSYSPTVTSAGQVARMNIVTRVVVEGKAKQGQDGASVKMYMKFSIPVDSVTPGSTIALFPEENVKILTSQIHPLDGDSAPYNFSSAASPLLHNAARALNLPARLSTTFDTAFRLNSIPNIASPTASTSHIPEIELSTIPPIDPQYTGQILVSGYHIAYVLPRQFPIQDHSRLEVEPERSSHPFHQKRRLSLGDRNHSHFMAGVDMWVPYVTRPPRSPYLLSIPTPRCLQNNIRLRIFPPSNVASSFASLSSVEDDANTWDLTSDPHVTRTTSNRLSRTSSYNHFADDESSDSSTNGFPDGFGIQGTFPSADRIRVRWAKPMRSFEETNTGGDARRKVGVKDVKSEMTCIVREGKKDSITGVTEGIVMDVEYKATCKGIWFPGVATLLGMDVGLVAKNSDVRWLEGRSSEWSVDGGVGYTGFNVAGEGSPDGRPLSGAPADPSLSQIHISSSPGGVPVTQANGRIGVDSSSSLLRAPLPSQSVPEYSFEGLRDPAASTSSNLETLSSVSLSQSISAFHPGVPLTLHLNINEILPPNKMPFTFTITGSILVTPRTSLSRTSGIQDSRLTPDHTEITEPVSLPHFTVLAADAEVTKISVRNEVKCSDTVVEVYSPSGDIYRDPQTRKTVLQMGGSTRCGADGGRIALKSIRRRRSASLSGRPQAQADGLNPLPPLNTIGSGNASPQVPVGPPIIPSVIAIVTPLLSRHGSIPDVYAVKIHLNTPVNTGTNWLEFGLARVGPSTSRTPLHHNGETWSPKVQIAGASVDGVPAQYAITNAEKQPTNGEALHGASFETMDSTEWASWVKLSVGPSSGCHVVIDYTVKTEVTKPSWIPNWNKRQRWNLLLPAFTLPVCALEIKLERLTGFEYSKIHSNLAHQHPHSEGEKLFHFTKDELFSPQVFVELSCTRKGSFPWLLNSSLWICLLLFALSQRLGQKPPQVWTPPDNPVTSASLDVINPIVTVTSTMANTVTYCPPSPPQSEEPTSTLDLPPIMTSSALHSLASLPTPTPALPTSNGLPTSPTTLSTPEASLSITTSFTSMLEMLGLDRVQDTLNSVSIPDLQFSIIKEKLLQYGGPVWEILWELFF